MKSYLKFSAGFLVCILLRLIPRPANVEPIMASLMPFSKKYGYVAAFSFAFLSILIFDLVTFKFGIWTWITASMYGFVGIASAWFFSVRKSTVVNYVLFAVFGTLIFDFVTMFIGPVFFKQSLMEAFVGQIPFTVIHLAGNVAFAVLLSPAIYSWILNNQFFDPSVFFKQIKETYPLT